MSRDKNQNTEIAEVKTDIKWIVKEIAFSLKY